MITINGKELKVKFNYYAIEQFAGVKGEAGSNVAYTVKLLWGGYQGYCFAENKEPEITYAEILDWLDDNLDNAENLKEVAVIKDEFLKSKAFEKLIKKSLKDNQETEEKKSQSNGTIYTPSFGEQCDLKLTTITNLPPIKDGASPLVTSNEN